MNAQTDTRLVDTLSNFVEQGILADIKPEAFSAWLVIRAHMDMQTGLSSISARKVAELSGLPLSTVQEALKTLEEKELLETVEGSYKTKAPASLS